MKKIRVKNAPINLPNQPLMALATFAGMALALLIASAPASAQTQDNGQAGNVQVFGDWHLRCQNVPLDSGGTADACALFQNLINPQDQKPIMQVAAGYWGPERRRGMIIKLPLGVTLPPGMELLVDDQPRFKAPFAQCLPDGCQAHVPMDDALLAAMQAGLQAKVSFRNAVNRPLSVGFSLKGFTKGFSQAR